MRIISIVDNLYKMSNSALTFQANYNLYEMSNILFSEQKKEIISKYCLLEILPKVLSVKC